jgi:hypothetical protein
MKSGYKTIWWAMLLIGIGIGISTRLSYVDTPYDIAGLKHFPVETMTLMEASDIAVIRSFEDLADYTQIVVRVRTTGAHSHHVECTLSEVEVLKVYKGNSSLCSAILQVYEPSYFVFFNNHPTSGYFMARNGYALMQDSKEYVLFLERIDLPVGFTLGTEASEIYRVTLDGFGKYDLPNQNEILQIDSGSPLEYHEIMSASFVSDDPDLIALYHQLSAEVIRRTDCDFECYDERR